MKKTLLTLFLTGMAATSAMAENATLDYTFAQNELFPYGKGKKETIDVAICINNPGLAGKKVTGIKAYINGSEGIDNTSLWLSKELKLESKVNVPDVTSVEVSPVATTVGDFECYVMETSLAEPYVLTAEPLYVGYTINVTENKTDEQKNPMVLSQGVNPNGFYLHMKSSVLQWMEYSDKAQGVALIVAEIEGDYPDYSLGLLNYDTIYAENDEKFAVNFSVANIGANPINQVAYSYTVDNGTEAKTGTATLEEGITPQLALSSPLSLNFEGISGVGPHTLNVEITEVNGKPNESLQSSLSCVVNVIPFIPVHRPLVEEFTGLWCGWCTRGYIAMELIAEQFGDEAVAIAYHNGDPMEVTQNYPVKVPGFPSSSLNRNSTIDPYYGSYDYEFGIATDIRNSIDEVTIAAIDLEASLANNKVNVTSTLNFIQSLDNANYQVGYVLVCNGLTGKTWAQSNYYSGDNSVAGTPLEVLSKWSDPVAGLVFNDVAVDVSGMNGVAGSIPATIVAGQEFTHEYSFDIEGNELVQDPENLVVTAFIIDKNSNKVVNANKFALTPAGIESIGMDQEAGETSYYDLTGRKVLNPGKGIYIERTKLSDGTFTSRKVMRR